jgi:hypothetical protein
MTKTQREREARKILKAFGLDVEAVAWIRRGDFDEFAAIVCANQIPEQYERALEILTDPKCPAIVSHEFVGKYDTRIYVAFAREA